MADRNTRIKAIETRYAGCNFRSRLEARWAVFFDALGVEWQYEPERFCLDRGTYLPDFYLPAGDYGNGTWVEVKGDKSSLDWRYIQRICDYDSPLPGVKDSVGSARGLLILGPIPRVESENGGWNHPLIQHRKGLRVSHATFCGSRDGGGFAGVLAFSGDTAYRVEKGVVVGEVKVRCPEMIANCRWIDFECEGPAPKDILVGHRNYGFGNSQLKNAYNKARSARFEHGQEGA